MRQIYIVFVIVCVIVICVPTLARSSATFINLGTLPGYTQSWAEIISADGTTVVGSSCDDNYDICRPFRWTKVGGMIDLAAGQPADGRIYPSGVSADGSVVIGYARDPYTGYNLGWIWTEKAGLVYLPTLGGQEAWPEDISSDGKAVAGTSSTIEYGSRAFLWTEAGDITDLGVLPGGNHSYASAISGDGTTVIGRVSVVDGLDRGFRWTEATGMQEIVNPYGGQAELLDVSSDGKTVVGRCGDRGLFLWTESEGSVALYVLPNVKKVYPVALSPDGSTIIGYHYNQSSSYYRAFRWTAKTGMVDLGTLNGTGASAGAVSVDGSVIVGMSGEPFRWTQEKGIHSVKDWLIDHGADVASYKFSYTNGISADGTAIIGVVKNGQGTEGPFYARVVQSSVPSISVTIAGTGKGQVTAQGFVCSSGTCAHPYYPSTVVTLIARAKDGAVFKGWERCDSISGAKCTVTMGKEDRLVKAIFDFVPRISVSPGSLNFGTVKKDEGTTRNLTIRNTGLGDLIVDSLTITGTSSSSFASGTCSAPITRETPCILPVTFTPTTYGTKTAGLIIISNTGNGKPATVRLAGSVLSPPKAITSPKVLNFGVVKPGDVPSTKTVTLKNKGQSDLIVSDVYLTGDASFSHDAACYTIPPGGSCPITVMFTPSNALPQTGILHIASDAPGSEVLVTLRGRGKQ